MEMILFQRRRRGIGGEAEENEEKCVRNRLGRATRDEISNSKSYRNIDQYRTASPMLRETEQQRNKKRRFEAKSGAFA